jgi:hypothetical protein
MGMYYAWGILPKRLLPGRCKEEKEKEGPK